MRTPILLFMAVFFGVSSTQAQDFSKLDKSPMDVVFIRAEDNSPMIRIIYSRPQKNDRKIFGNLVPFGEVWRTGANEATEITLYKDMSLSGKLIPAGTYSLYTIPNQNEWTVILNEDVSVWGAYNYDKTKDILRTKVPVERTSVPVEAFSMALQPIENGGNLLIGWDDTYVEVPFTITKM